MKKGLLFIIFVVIAGCVNPVNQKTATNYYKAGEEALAQGNLPHAKEMFGRALVNARLGNMGPEAEASLLMKLGKINGNMCEYESAEKDFIDAILLYSKAYGEKSLGTFPSRIELAQFAYDIGWYEKSVTYYERALEIGGEKAKEANPTAFYEIIRDYSDALATTGKVQKAKEYKKLLEVNSTEKNSSDYVRYPKECK